MTATVQGAPRKAAEAATRIAPEGTSRSQLQQATSPNSKSHPILQPMPTSDTKSSHQASPAVIHQAPGKAPSLHARTARALSTPPSGALRLSAMNPTATSRSRTPQSAKLTTCASMDSINRMTNKHRKGGSHRSRKAKFSKVNRVQSEDGEEEDDDSWIDSEVSSDSSVSVDRPPKSIVGRTDQSPERYPRSEQCQPYIGPPKWCHRPRTTLEMPHLKQTTATPRSQPRENKYSPSR